MAHEWMRGRRLEKKVGAKIGTRQLLGAVGEASIDLCGVVVRRRKKGEMLATMTMLREQYIAARTFAQDKQRCS